MHASSSSKPIEPHASKAVPDPNLGSGVKQTEAEGLIQALGSNSRSVDAGDKEPLPPFKPRPRIED
jgi:hypothetical protein